MGWLSRFFGVEDPNPTQTALIVGFYKFWCNMCNIMLKPDEEIGEIIQDALKEVSPVDFEREVRILDLYVALEILYQKPWGKRVGLGLMQLATMRIIIAKFKELAEELPDLDSGIPEVFMTSLEETDPPPALAQTLVEIFGGPVVNEALELIHSRLRGYEAIVAEGWHPASTRLGAYALQAMTGGTGQRNFLLEMFLWNHYVSSQAGFMEFTHSIETKFNLQ